MLENEQDGKEDETAVLKEDKEIGRRKVETQYFACQNDFIFSLFVLFQEYFIIARK